MLGKFAEAPDWCRGGLGSGVVRVENRCGFWWQEWEAWGRRLLRIAWFLGVQCRRPEFPPWVGKITWRREQLPTPVFLSGKSHGQRCLVGYSPTGSRRVGHNRATKPFSWDERGGWRHHSHLLICRWTLASSINRGWSALGFGAKLG